MHVASKGLPCKSSRRPEQRCPFRQQSYPRRRPHATRRPVKTVCRRTERSDAHAVGVPSARPLQYGPSRSGPELGVDRCPSHRTNLSCHTVPDRTRLYPGGHEPPTSSRSSSPCWHCRWWCSAVSRLGRSRWEPCGARWWWRSRSQACATTWRAPLRCIFGSGAAWWPDGGTRLSNRCGRSSSSHAWRFCSSVTWR